MPSLSKSILPVLSLGLSLFASPLAAQERVTAFDQIEGAWRGFDASTNVESALSATASGALLTLRPRFGLCTYVISPEVRDGLFPAYLIKDSRKQCQASDDALIVVDGQSLSVSLVGQWGTDRGLSMGQEKGHSATARVFPEAAVLGVRLGMSFADARAQLPAEMRVGREQSSRRVVRGTRQLDGRYIQGLTPYGGELAGADASQDTIGLYRIDGDANTGVMALLRAWVPAPLDAPAASSFLAALTETYGAPSTTSRSGPNDYLTWHFGPDGTRAAPATIDACEAPTNSRSAKRTVAMLFTVLEFFSTGRASQDGTSMMPNLSPRAGCGYTLQYEMRRRDNGSLESAKATFFDHRALAAAIWAEERDQITKEIERALSQVEATSTNESKL